MRIHGFDAIPSTLPDLGVPDGPPTGRQLLRRRVRRVLSAAGYVEAIQWAFLSREAAASVAPLGAYDGRSADEETDVVLDNPLSELYSTLRRSLLPGLLEAARFNTRRNASSVRLFELGVVFGRSGSGEGPVGVVEREALGVLCGGAVGTPWEGRRELDLFDLKGALEAVAEAAGKRLEARPGRIHGLLPGTAAELYIEGVDGRRVGVLGRLAEDDEHYPLYAAEIELAALESTSEELYAALAVDSPPRLPGIQVDHTLTHPVAVAWADLESAIRESAAEELRRFRLENRYEGKGVPDGAVNTTVRFLYHGGERQLTQDEVNRHQEALVAVLEERFGWKAGQEDVAGLFDAEQQDVDILLAGKVVGLDDRFFHRVGVVEEDFAPAFGQEQAGPDGEGVGVAFGVDQFGPAGGGEVVLEVGHGQVGVSADKAARFGAVGGEVAFAEKAVFNFGGGAVCFEADWFSGNGRHGHIEMVLEVLADTGQVDPDRNTHLL
jgi:hypothetical protein